MATPVIDSATIDPQTVAPGGTATLTVTAHDPDQRDITLTVTAADQAGTTAIGTLTLHVSDPVTVTATCDDASVTVTPVAGKPGVFTVAVAA